VLGLAAGIAVACGGANAGPATSNPAGSSPTLHVLAGYPVAVRGTGFRGRERVVVTALSGRKRVVRRSIASSKGAFKVALPGADAGACVGFSVTAVGSRGSRATIKRSPGVCPQP
jgi:hypothetical protein